MKEKTIIVLGGGGLILILILFAPHELETSTNVKDINFAVSPESFEANITRASGFSWTVVVENKQPFETSIDLKNCKFEKKQLEFNTYAANGTNYLLSCYVGNDAPPSMCISETSGYDYGADCKADSCPEGFECVSKTYNGFLRFFQADEEIKKLPITLTVN